MELWNMKYLPQPPVSSFRAENRIIDINTLSSAVSVALAIFSNQKDLQFEAAILSRCIYRMKMKFRGDKGQKFMEKINHGLLLLLRMRVPEMLNIFNDMIPTKYTQDTYFPTLNMLHYILVRIQGLAKLLVRIGESCMSAVYFFQNRIYIGHMWRVSLILIAGVSRVFRLTKNLIRTCSTLYSELLPFTRQLKNTGTLWLPTNYSFPNDLQSWLDINWLLKDEDVMVTDEPQSQMSKIMNLMGSDDDEIRFCKEYIDLDLLADSTEESSRPAARILEKPITVKSEIETLTSDIIDVDSVMQESVIVVDEITNYGLNESSWIVEDIGEIVSTSQPNQTVREHQTVFPRPTKCVPLRTSLAIVDYTTFTRNEIIGGIRNVKDVRMFSHELDLLMRENRKIFDGLDNAGYAGIRKAIKKTLTKIKKCKGAQVKRSLVDNLRNTIRTLWKES